MNKVVMFMRLCLVDKIIPMSWGISNIDISQNSIRFDVWASKYQGMVMIIEAGSKIKVIMNNVSERCFSDVGELLIWLDKEIE